jgi:Tfp pilus assembly protein PilZ
MDSTFVKFFAIAKTLNKTLNQENVLRPVEHLCKSKKHPSSAKTVFFETYPRGSDGDYFYTGFSGKIEDGGIFLQTYRLLTKYTPIGLTIHLPDLDIHTHGIVDWIREYNPTTPSTPPGIGVALNSLSSHEVKMIETFMETYPPLFMDNSPVQPVDAKHFEYGDDIELTPLPLNMGPGVDLNAEQQFISGMAKDIEFYIQSQIKQKASRLDTLSKNNAFNTISPNKSEWRIKKSQRQHPKQFLNGFGDNDRFRVFVQTRAQMQIGTVMPLEIETDQGFTIHCVGEVKWVRRPNPLVQNHSIPAGIGITLYNISETTWNQLRAEDTDMMVCEPV